MSVIVTLSQEDMDAADAIGAERQRLAEARGRPNLRVALVPDIVLNQVGARGEMAVARHYGVAPPRVDTGALRDDALGDVGGVEVKTRLTNGPPRLLLWKARPGAIERPVVLVVPEFHRRFRIVGWMWASEVRVDAYWDATLPRPCWAVPQDDLLDPALLALPVMV